MASIDNDCPVCFELYNNNLIQVNCCIKHYICHDCRTKIEQLNKIQHKCPICRSPFVQLEHYMTLANIKQQEIEIFNKLWSSQYTEFKTSYGHIKSISDRIKGKQRRIPSNLMGKRIDFSAYAHKCSVITTDLDINLVHP